MLVSGARFVGMAALVIIKWVQPRNCPNGSPRSFHGLRETPNGAVDSWKIHKSQKSDESLMLDNFRRVIFFSYWTLFFWEGFTYRYHPQLCHTHIDLGVSQSQAENKETNN